MPRHIALLRAINVGGHNVKMAKTLKVPVTLRAMSSVAKLAAKHC